MKKLYMLKLGLMVVLSVLTIGSAVGQQTWYALNGGDWDNHNNWTLDPAAAIYYNPSGGFPKLVTDNVVIKTGVTITVPVREPALVLNCGTITVNGRLELGTTSGHSFTAIRGNGRMLMQGDNFPAGDATHFISKNLGEGTVVYKGTGYSISSEKTFYNVEIDLTSGVLALGTNVTVKGNLNVLNGELRIGNSVTPRTLTVEGDINVASSGSITVAAFNATHTVKAYGNISNNGAIRLTNLDKPTYNADATNGTATLEILGLSNTTLTASGTTDLQRLIIDKGQDQSYVFTINSSNEANLRLFGRNNNAYDQKALRLKNGTLRLTGQLFIPTLTEGNGDFYVESNAALWLDGSGVKVFSTARNNEETLVGGVAGTGVSASGGAQSFSVNGRFRITDGLFETKSHGFVVWDAGKAFVQIDGGTIITPGFRSAGSNTGKWTYQQSGGLVQMWGDVNSDLSGSGSPTFHIKGENNVFIMTGGIMEIFDAATTGNLAVGIESGEGNYSVTGGTVRIKRADHVDVDNNYLINSTAPFYNFEIGVANSTQSANVTLGRKLRVLNNILIDNKATLDVTTGNYDLNLGGNLTIENGGAYNARANTTTFDGAKNSSLFNNLSENIVLNNLVVDKSFISGGSYNVELSGNSGFTVAKGFEVKRGTFLQTGVDITVNGSVSLFNGDIVSSGGVIKMGASSQLFSERGKEFGFGIIEVNGNLTLSSNIRAQQFIFTGNYVVDLGAYNLELEEAFYTSAGWSVTRMFKTNGQSSDGGLTLPVVFTGSAGYGGGTVVQFFPVGTYNGTLERDAFNPVFIDARNTPPATNGKVTVRPVDGHHPTVNDANKVLPYFWRVASSGLDNITNNHLRYRLRYDGTIDNPINKGSILHKTSWVEIGINKPEIQVPFNTATLYFDGDFTMGNPSDLKNPEVFYSLTSGAWDEPTTWTKSNTHTGLSAGPPTASDMVVIGGFNEVNHKVTITGNDRAAQIQIKGKSDTGIAAGDPPTLEVLVGAGPVTYTWVKQGNRSWYNYTSGNEFGDIYGKGRVLISGNNMPTANLAGFVNNNEAIIEYSGGSAYVLPLNTYRINIGGSNSGNISIFNFNEYPNLHISGLGEKAAADVNVKVNGDVLINAGTLRLSESAGGDFIIARDLDISAGNLVLPGVVNRQMVVNGDINFLCNGVFEVAAGADDKVLHRIDLYGHLAQGAGTINFNSTAKAQLNFVGSESVEFTKTGATGTDFWKITMQKTEGEMVHFKNGFALHGNTTEEVKSLTIFSGIAWLDNSAIDVVLSSGGAAFKIPSGSELRLSNGAKTSMSGSTGIWLDGKLTIDGGVAQFDGGDDNYIEYTTSGHSEVEVKGAGRLHVGSQLRRSFNTEAGILKYAQTGPLTDVKIGTKGVASNSRGFFEILNSGSSFTLADGAQLQVLRGHSGSAIADVWFDPAMVNMAEGTGFVFGPGDSNDIDLYAAKPVRDLIVSDGTRVALKTLPLTVEGDLIIGTSLGGGSEFHTGSLGLVLYGDMTNRGAYVKNGNTTLFKGTRNQMVLGQMGFHYMIKEGASDLDFGDLDGSTTANRVNIVNKLTLISGNINTNRHWLRIIGDMVGNGTITSNLDSEGVVFNQDGFPATNQSLSGDLNIGILNINNPLGVSVPTQSGLLTINDKLILTQGVLDIGRNLINIKSAASILNGSGEDDFSASNMIQTNLSFTDAGIRKYLPIGAMAEPIVFPIGSAGKYTPVTLAITSNATDNGFIRVKAANEPHVTVLDAGNVLNYNWTLDAAGISGFSARAVMQAMPADALVSDPNVLADYVAARILAGSSDWNKLDNIYDNGTLIEGFNSTDYQVVFRFNNTGPSLINGDYTAGVKTAIPDQVPSYVTVKDGDWTDASTWAVYNPLTGTSGEAGVSVPDGGPRGSQIVVNHNLNLAQNFMSSFRTKINSEGKVLVGNTLNHRFGDVTGTGRIVLHSGSFPAGVYADFFSALGGTVEFTGAGEYDVLSEVSTVNSLIFSGTGIRRLANLGLILNGSLAINGPQVVNEFSSKLSIKKDVDFSGGSFNAKNGDFELSGAVPQTIGGAASFTGVSALHNLIVNNTSGIGLQQSLEVKNHLTFVKGLVNSTSASPLILSSTGSDVVTGVSPSTYVSGPVVKNINDGNSFAFPTGKDGRFGQISLNGVGASGLWTTEYFNTGASDRGSFDESVKYVSNNEYWQVTSPVSDVNASATLRWDANSGVNPDDAAFRVVSSTGVVWSAVDYSDKIGTMSAGTVKTAALNYASTRRFTFGSNSIDPYTWNGTTIDWFTGSNWTGGAVPSASNNAIVATSSVDPVINSGAIAQTNDLTINAGATLILNPGGKLTVNGNLVIENNPDDLVIVEPGDREKPRGLLLKNETGPDGMASLLTHGTVTGEAKVQMEFPRSDTDWYYVSHPVKDAMSSIYLDFDGEENVDRDISFIAFHRNNTWYRVARGNIELWKLEGISVQYKNMEGVSNYLLSYNGVLNSGEIPRSFPDKQYYLFGNPYASFINWQDDLGWTRTNIGGTIWYRTRVKGNMGFVTYNRFAPSGARVSVFPDGLAGTQAEAESELAKIPPMQSVWIESLGTGQITLNNNVRSHGVNNSFLKSASQSAAADIIRITTENATGYDGAVLYFSSDSQEGIDRGDSEKMFNESIGIPEVFTKVNDKSLSINGLPLMNESVRSIPLSVRNRVEGEVTMKFDLSSYFGQHAPYLEDRETGAFINLLQESSYLYTVSQIGENHDRFVLNFYYVTTDLEAPGEDETDAGISINIKSIAGKVLVSVGMDLLQDGDGLVEIYTIEGRKVGEVPARSSRTLLILPRESGVYIIRAKFGNHVKSERVVGAIR